MKGKPHFPVVAPRTAAEMGDLFPSRLHRRLICGPAPALVPWLGDFMFPLSIIYSNWNEYMAIGQLPICGILGTIFPTSQLSPLP